MPNTTLTEAAYSAAAKLHDTADALPRGKVARATRATADAMQTAAGYVSDRDWEEMLDDVRSFARRHPGATLLTCAAAGFLLARSLSRR